MKTPELLICCTEYADQHLNDYYNNEWNFYNVGIENGSGTLYIANKSMYVRGCCNSDIVSLALDGNKLSCGFAGIRKISIDCLYDDIEDRLKRFICSVRKNRS